MDIFCLIMLVLGCVGIFSGFLFGLSRGLFKSTVRLIIIVVCALLAFVLKEKITNEIVNYPIVEGQSLLELLTGSISGENAESMKGLMEVVANIVRMVLQVLVFILTFVVLRTVSMIVYWVVTGIITSIHNKSSKRSYSSENYETLTDEEKKALKKKDKVRGRLPGALVGLAQAIIVISCVLGPLNGLIVNASSIIKSLSELEMNGSPVIGEDLVDTFDDLGLMTYDDSTVCKVYSITGNVVYEKVATIKDKNGRVINIQTQIEAIDGGIKMVNSVLELTNVDLSNGLTDDTVDELVDVFKELDTIKNDMSDESVEELNKIVKDALTPMLDDVSELPINLDEIDFEDVDFAKEGEVIETLYDMMEKAESGESIDKDGALEEVITTLSDSTLILPVLSQIDTENTINLSAEDKNKVKDIIDNLPNQENADKLKDLFGIE